MIFSCCFGDEPVWPSDKAIWGWYAGGPQFDSASAVLSLQKVWFMDTAFVTLPLTVNETLFKMALIAAHLNARVILVVTA